MFAHLKINFTLRLKDKNIAHNQKYQCKESIFLFFGYQNLGTHTSILL